MLLLSRQVEMQTCVWRPSTGRFRVFGTVLAVLTLGCGQRAAEAPDSPPALLSAAQSVSSPDVVTVRGSTRPAPCGGCHSDLHSRWSLSHHASSIAPASAQTVKGDFNNVTVSFGGETARFYREGERFMVETGPRAGARASFPVRYTFGVEPLQQVLLDMPNGALQAFTLAWDTQQKQWFDLQESPVSPGDSLHWTGRQYTWASACAACHSTGFVAHYDEASRVAHPTWQSLPVDCGACHSFLPAQHGQTGAPAQPAALKSMTLEAAQAQVESCAPCHSRHYLIAEAAASGAHSLDYRVPELLSEGLYYPDGQIQGEVFEVGSFVQSRMYQAGVACSDCHDPHSLSLRDTGNALCTSCHTSTPRPSIRQRFPTLKLRAYDDVSHHHHTQGTPGGQCVSCHMPEKRYMKIDGRRDHSLRIPRPDLTESLGTPNACSSCHTDMSAQWATQALDRWSGTGWKRPSPAPVLAAGRARQPEAAGGLLALVADEQQSILIRATALELLGRLEPPAPALPDAILESLASAQPLLRTVAARVSGTMRILPIQQALQRLLSDPVRAVRLEAANALAGVPLTSAPAAVQSAFEAALREYEVSQRIFPDQPEGHANLGTLYLKLGRALEAERALKAAVEVDPGFFPAQNNLGQLYYQQGRMDEAELAFRRALQAAPGQGQLHYALGLLLEERGRTAEALPHLRAAAEALPTSGRVLRNYGLMLVKAGKKENAARVLSRAAVLLPEDSSIRAALQGLTRSTSPRSAAKGTL